MELISQAEFARRKGVSQQAVQQSIGRRIQLEPGTKKIDWDTQSVAWEVNASQASRLGYQLRAKREKLQPKFVTFERPAPAPTPPPPPPPPPPPNPERKAPEPKAPKPPKPPKVEKPKSEPKQEATEPKSKKQPPPRSQEDLEREEHLRKQLETASNAKTAQEVYKAQKLQIEVEELRGELLRKDKMKAALQKLALAMKSHLFSIADELAPLLVGRSSQHDIHAMIVKELNKNIQGFQDGIAKLGN